MKGTGDTERAGAAGDRAAPDGPAEAVVELPDYAERVLGVAELIPPGKVMTYGDVAEWLKDEEHPQGPAPGGPRQVGRVMALYGGAVPWWRVVRADGVLLPGSELRALAHYRDEGTPLKGASAAAIDGAAGPRTESGEASMRGGGRATGGRIPRIDMRRARWDGGDEGRGAP
ncbi:MULTISPECIES: MGMT family protein [unclassified Streptomyces]|uniref:MGMT family protein n=1 Tax=unclassified Streptomyces TaxID=2593676 RepID=UPI000373E286|nr:MULTISPECIES: MGMT family protein [unclassified Streptomyces]